MMEACRNNRKRHISSQGGHFSSKHVSSFSMLIVKQVYNDTGLTFSKVSLLCCALPRSMNMKCEREKLMREREDNCWCGNISSNSHVQREKSKRREESRRIWPLYLTFDKEGTKRGKDKERDVMEQKGERKRKKRKKKKKKKRLSDKLKEWEMELHCIVEWIHADSNVSNRRRLETLVRRGFCALSLQQLWSVPLIHLVSHRPLSPFPPLVCQTSPVN